MTLAGAPPDPFVHVRELLADPLPAGRLAALESAAAAARQFARDSPSTARTTARTHLAAGMTEPLEAIVVRLLVATIFDELGLLAAAAEVLTPLEVDARLGGDPALHLMVLVARGRLLVMQGDEAGAIAVLLAGVERAQALGAKLQEAKMLGNLGFLHGERDGRAYEAYTRRALAIGRELDEPRLVAHSLCNLGGALVQLGRHDEAKACFEEGRPLAVALGWAQSVALYDAGLGGLSAATGDLETGVRLYESSMAYFAGVGDHFQVARQSMVVARHLIRARCWTEAQPHINRSLHLCDGEVFRNTEWQARELLSHVLEVMGDPGGALMALRASVQLRETMAEARFTERVRLLELHVAMERAQREADWARQRAAELEAIARTDALTGLSNRRHVEEVVAREVARARRSWRPLALALVDADRFKAVNDEHGHAAGDAVLCALAGHLRAGVREYDLAARWGGEEFCLIFPDTDLERGRAALLRILERIRFNRIALPTGALVVTVSAGLTALEPSDSGLDDLLRRADRALYASKRSGRDRLTVEPA
jgi:diguanylate cyclase (GGDEF)-like protein